MDANFIQLLHQHQHIVLKVSCIYMDTADDREDLFQEITLQAWKSFASFRGEARFSTWLYRVALNTALTYFKKEKRRAQAEASWSAEPYCMMYPQDDPMIGALHCAIADLNTVDKALVTLYLEDYDYQQMSEILGITANHIAVKMSRIRTKLKSETHKHL